MTVAVVLKKVQKVGAVFWRVTNTFPTLCLGRDPKTASERGTKRQRRLPVRRPGWEAGAFSFLPFFFSSFLFSLLEECWIFELWTRTSPQTTPSFLSSYASGELSDRATTCSVITNDCSHRHEWPVANVFYRLYIQRVWIIGQFHFLTHTYTKSLGLFERKCSEI